MKEINTILAEQFKAFRLSRHMTQAAFAKELHMTTRAYRYLESGTKCPSASTLFLFLTMLPDHEAIELIAHVSAHLCF